MANQFSVQPLGGFNLGQGVQQMGQSRAANKERRDEEEARQRGQQVRTQAAEMFQAGDFSGLAQLSIQNPELAQTVSNAYNIRDKASGHEQLQWAKSIASGRNPQKAVVARMDRLREQGIPSDETAWLQDASDNEIKKHAMGIIALNDPRGFESFIKSQGGSGAKKAGIGNISPKDFTAESLAAYEQSGNLNDLTRYTPAVKEIAGIPHQFNQSTSMWEPLVNMRGKGLSEQVDAATELEARKQSKLDFTKQQSKFKAGESKLLSKISSAKANQTLLANTAQQIKGLLSGWNSSYGASLALLPATEARKLKGLINTIKANSAFSTLTDLKDSGGTLGAISAPELVLLEAKLGSLDQYGDIPEMERILDQILQANTGALTRVENAYEMDKGKYGSSFEEATKPSDEDILKKYGG